MDQAVPELVNSGRVRIVNEQPFVVNPLSVSIQPCGKKRLILDLRHVNKSLNKQSVKYEDWKNAMSYFAKDAYMFSFDLKSGYYHIDIAKEHQTFLVLNGGRLIPLMKYFMFSLCSRSVFPLPLMFSQRF